jgi:hypothetical protein
MNFLNFDKLDQLILNYNKLLIETEKLSNNINNTTSDIRKLHERLERLFNKLNIDNPYKIDCISNEEKSNINLLNNLIDESFIENTKIKVRKEIQEDIKLPELSTLDTIITGIIGIIAALIDILIVKIPRNINYMNKYYQEGSSFTNWLRSLGIDENGNLNPFLKYLEDKNQVPFDMSINPGTVSNFYPGNHRLLSLGHDPLFGLIFGTIDILNGQVSLIDGKGIPHIISTYDISTEDKLFAPIIWLSHIISDICTSRGIPIPGWGFSQLIQIGDFGKKHRNIAEISRWMYENGYDLRHFVTMNIVPATIEILVHLYHILSIDKINDNAGLAEKEFWNIKNKIKLHKMLFYSHAIASAGNVLKIAFYNGNPLALNISEWVMLFKRGFDYLNIKNAYKKNEHYEKIINNRKKINDKWKELDEKFN